MCGYYYSRMNVYVQKRASETACNTAILSGFVEQKDQLWTDLSFHMLYRIVGEFVNSIRARLRYPDISVYLLIRDRY